jgi:hypothetical protein
MPTRSVYVIGLGAIGGKSRRNFLIQSLRETDEINFPPSVRVANYARGRIPTMIC